jgi:hypothetical protein
MFVASGIYEVSAARSAQSTSLIWRSGERGRAMTEQLRMRAYYYSFDETGVPEIDKILSAVACAGKFAHHTDSWGDEGEWPPHTGANPVEWIQNAANEAAEKWRAVGKESSHE